MNTARGFSYRVNLAATIAESISQQVEFEIINHDDIFKLLALIQGKLDIKSHEEQAFLIGLKMFSEILLINRQHALFRQMKAPMREIMSLLKDYMRDRV